MSDEQKEPWLNYLALTTVILAVAATLSTFKGGGFSTRSVMAQSEAANKWAHYQSKSIKGTLHEINRDNLKLELEGLDPKANGGVRAKAQQALGEAEKRIAKYDKEKAEIMAEAQTREHTRDDAQKHSQAFGLAVIFLQIAILLSSIAALLKQRMVWVIGCLVGAVGLLYFANGFWLFL